MAAASQELSELASLSIRPGELRRVLGHYVCTGNPSVLTALVEGAAAALQSGVYGTPRTFLSFNEPTSLAAAPLRDAVQCIGATGFSIWMCLRWEGSNGTPADLVTEVVCALLSPDGGYGLHVLIVDSRLTVRMCSAKGGCSEVRMERPLAPRRWFWLVIEHTAPERRWIPTPFNAKPEHAAGKLRLYVDARLELSATLEFPAPTASLRYVALGGVLFERSAAGARSFRGQIGELLLIPSSDGVSIAPHLNRRSLPLPHLGD